MTATEQLDDVQLDHLTRVGAASGQPPIRPQRARWDPELRAADRVDHRIGSPTAGQLRNRLGTEVVIAERLVGSQLEHHRQLRRVARRGDHPRAGDLRALHRRPATPPDADGTSTVSPLGSGQRNTMLHAVLTTHWAAAAAITPSSPSATRARAGTRTSSAYPPRSQCRTR